MTLSRDLSRVLDLGGVSDADVDTLVGDENLRYPLYLSALAAAPPGHERELVDIVRRDPDRVMAESALVAHLDRRAAAMPDGSSVLAWAVDVLGEDVNGSSFVARRVREWQLFQAVAHGEPFDRADLEAASNWLQRKIVDSADSAAALAVIGQAGRTKRVRNLAKTRVGRLPDR